MSTAVALGRPRGILRPPPIVAAVAFVNLALLLWCATRYGYFRDELYYLACARRLAWGYVGVPPLSIAMLALVQRIYGETLLSIRLVPALAAALVVILTARLAARFGAGTAAQGLAALSVLGAPELLAEGHVYSMASLDVVFWTVTAGLVARALTADPEAATLDWLRVGMMIGLGLLNRLTMLAFVAALVLGIACTEQRRWAKHRGPWLALGVAAVVVAPYLAWERGHDWPVRELATAWMHRTLAGASPLDFAWAELGMILPANVLVLVAGLVGLLRSPRLVAYRPFGVAFVVLALGLMVGGRGTAPYLVPACPVMFAAGATTLDAAVRELATRRRLWAAIALALFLAVPGALAAPLAIPLFRVAPYRSYARALHVARDGGADEPSLPPRFADMYGWPELARVVASVVDELPPRERIDAVILASNVGEAGALELFGSLVGLPAVISGHDQFWLWGTLAASGRVVVAVGGDEVALRGMFRTVEVATVFGHSLAMPSERHVKIYVCRDSVEPLDVLWPALKVYD